jgi:hypothetical protein
VLEKGDLVKTGHSGKQPNRKTMETIRRYRGDTSLATSSLVNGTQRALHTIGWGPGCKCGLEEPVPCVVLDPFNGAGSTGLAALRHQRRYIGIDASEEYLGMTERRIASDWRSQQQHMELTEAM